MIFIRRAALPYTNRQLSSPKTGDYSSFSSPKMFNYPDIISHFRCLSMDSGQKTGKDGVLPLLHNGPVFKRIGGLCTHFSYNRD